jgi:hypothetical protein
MPEAATVTEIPDMIEALRELVRQLQNQLLWAEERYKALEPPNGGGTHTDRLCVVRSFLL